MLQLPKDEQNQEFVSLLTTSHGKLLGYLMTLLGVRQDSEDVLQKASLIMWQKFDDFESGTDFVAWASTICFYEAKNFQRLAARSPLQFDDALLEKLSSERLVDLPNQSRRISALEVCMGKLRDSDRDLVNAAYLDGNRISELASSLDRAPQTIYNKLNLIKKTLTDCVQQTLDAESTR